MSTYEFQARDKETNEKFIVTAHDDYFAHHVYGYRLGKSEEVLTEAEFFSKYERTDVPLL